MKDKLFAPENVSQRPNRARKMRTRMLLVPGFSSSPKLLLIYLRTCAHVESAGKRLPSHVPFSFHSTRMVAMAPGVEEKPDYDDAGLFADIDDIECLIFLIG